MAPRVSMFGGITHKETIYAVHVALSSPVPWARRLHPLVDVPSARAAV
jgi:hypothetical protein